VSAPLEPAHSHTTSFRIANGEEVLVVRVLTRAGAIGFGFTFSENVASARTMASWDAAARNAGRPLWQLLRDAPPADLAALEATVEPGSHPWSVAWRAVLAAARGAGAPTSQAPGAGIDWTLEPGFTTLRWIDSETNREDHHGRTAD
jgi:L-alanine-DL-glutamate epimerase-like enolase superfamily enzyme